MKIAKVFYIIILLISVFLQSCVVRLSNDKDLIKNDLATISTIVSGLERYKNKNKKYPENLYKVVPDYIGFFPKNLLSAGKKSWSDWYEYRLINDGKSFVIKSRAAPNKSYSFFVPMLFTVSYNNSIFYYADNNDNKKGCKQFTDFENADLKGNFMLCSFFEMGSIFSAR